MRTIVAAGIIALTAAPCCAQSLATRVVAIFKEACTDATTPEAMIAAGEKLATNNNWKLIEAGSAPLPMMHMESGPKLSYASQWDIAFAEKPGTVLTMSIVRPATEDVRKFSVCGIQPTTGLGAQILVEEIERQFGSAITKDASGRYRDQVTWFFSNEKATGNCGRNITLLLHETSSRGTPASLLFQDLEIAKKWPLSEMARCPS